MNTGKRATPRQERSAQTVEAILDAANRVFAEHEVDVATTTMIAKQAGVSVGALYRFFEDKSALALALTERWFLDFVAIIQRVDALIDADGIDAMEDAMAAIIEGIGDFSRDNPSYFAVMRHLRNHKLRELQIDKLAQWFEVSPENLDYDDRYRLGLFVSEATRALLERAPVEEPARAKYLQEIRALLLPYVKSHLYPDS